MVAQRDVANKLGLGVIPIDFTPMGVDNPIIEHQEDHMPNSSQVSTPNPRRLQGVAPNRTDTQKSASARSRSESHPPATPGSEAADLSTCGLSESPRSHFVKQPSSPRSHFINQPSSPLPFRQSAVRPSHFSNQPSSSSYPPADDPTLNSVKLAPIM